MSQIPTGHIVIQLSLLYVVDVPNLDVGGDWSDGILVLVMFT
jgi:hypothetical protein